MIIAEGGPSSTLSTALEGLWEQGGVGCGRVVAGRGKEAHSLLQGQSSGLVRTRCSVLLLDPSMPTTTMGIIAKQNARPPLGMHCGGLLPWSRLAGGGVGAVMESSKGGFDSCLGTF